MLDINDMTISYGDNRVIEHFNLSVKPGEIVSLVGESGSGKTTVVRAIMGLLPGNGKIESGAVIYDGRDLSKLTDKEMKTLRGSEISMIFQDCGAMLNPIRRIGSQFQEYLRIHDKKLSKDEARKKAESMLTLMSLPDSARIMRSYPFQLSGGQRQRIGIAMAMSFAPKLLLADEPTSALDVTIQAQIVRQILLMRDMYHSSVIMVTHNLGVAAYVSDKILVMKNGSVVESGTRDEILKHPKMDYTKKLIEAIPVMDGEIYV